jgi:hypothetical protein
MSTKFPESIPELILQRLNTMFNFQCLQSVLQNQSAQSDWRWKNVKNIAFWSKMQFEMKSTHKALFDFKCFAGMVQR